MDPRYVSSPHKVGSQRASNLAAQTWCKIPIRDKNTESMEPGITTNKGEKHSHHGWTPLSTPAKLRPRKSHPTPDDGGPDWNSNQSGGESSPASPRCHEQAPGSEKEVKIRCWAKTPIKPVHNIDECEPPLFNHSP